MNANQIIINRTKTWLIDVVIGCNFCPFAAKEVKKNSIRYEVINSEKNLEGIHTLLSEYQLLDKDASIETTLLIFPNTFFDFQDYLKFLGQAEKSLQRNKYEGIYQLAGFHPLYQFAETTLDDAPNYTNRSPYPMIHILREESVERAIASYPNVENIPIKNMKYARNKGLAYMQGLRDAIFQSS